MNNYPPGKIKEVGDTVFAIVTDHPRYPRIFTLDSYAVFLDRVVAERIATAWNSFCDGTNSYPFYVREVILVASPEMPKEVDPYAAAQLSLW